MNTLKESCQNEDKMIIYQIKNNINGKIYIGQTINYFKRRYRGGKWWSFNSSNNKHLCYAAKKYGTENFSVSILEKNISSLEELDRLEKFYIKELNSIYPNGYNYQKGGQKSKNRTHHPKSCERIAKSHSGGKIYRLLNNRTGVIHEFVNMQKFADENNLSGPMLSVIFSKKVNSFGNLYYKQHKEWSLPENPIRKILFISPDNKEYIVMDGVDGGVKGFCKKQGFKSTSNVFATINGEFSQAYGWKMKILNKND